MLKLQWEGLVFGGCDCPLEGPRSLPANHLSAQGLSRSLGSPDGTTWGCPLRRNRTLTKGGKQAMNKRSTHRALCRFFARCGRNGTGAMSEIGWRRFYFVNTLKTKMFLHRLMASSSDFHSSHGASSPVLAQIGKPLCKSLMQAGHRRQAAHSRFSSSDSVDRFALGALRRHGRACHGHPRLGFDSRLRRGCPAHRRAKRRRPSDGYGPA